MCLCQRTSQENKYTKYYINYRTMVGFYIFYCQYVWCRASKIGSSNWCHGGAKVFFLMPLRYKYLIIIIAITPIAKIMAMPIEFHDPFGSPVALFSHLGFKFWTVFEIHALDVERNVPIFWYNIRQNGCVTSFQNILIVAGHNAMPKW